MSKAINLRVFPACGTDRIWRDEVNHAPQWAPSASDYSWGSKVNMPDGIYVVTVSEKTPPEWIHLAWKVAVIAKGQHPESGFLPMSNYDSAIAVHKGRAVGAAWARIRKQCPYYWNVSLKPDGTPFDIDEFPPARAENEVEGEEEGTIDEDEDEDYRAKPETLIESTEPGALIPRTSGELIVPTIMTIWVHRASRRKGIGRQLVVALAGHFGLPVGQIGFRLPLWKESVHMVLAMGLSRIVGGF